jgi:hypothetical protein
VPHNLELCAPQIAYPPLHLDIPTPNTQPSIHPSLAIFIAHERCLEIKASVFLLSKSIVLVKDACQLERFLQVLTLAAEK